MKFRFVPPASKNSFETEEVEIEIGSLSVVAHVFPDCKEAAKEELQLMKTALGAHQELVKAVEYAMANPGTKAAWVKLNTALKLAKGK